ncbi:MAG: glycerol-3-phosphate acyltransferase [Dehalococcoidales bacterium]|jgi:glycerol-3-phosphate acyltransferase PlsY
MLSAETLSGIIVIIAGYLLGSFPSAYLVTRLVKGQDIRRLGGGNVGGLNTFREVGVLPALVVALIDVGKGAAVVALAHWTLDLPQPWVLAAALAAVAGHNWMVWLKFHGGKGAGTTIGALSVLLPLYGYWPGLVIFLTVVIIPLAITRNISLAIGAGLVSLPFIAWLGMGSGMLVIWSIMLGLIAMLKFYPTARQAWAKTDNTRGFIFDRWHRGER